MAETTETPPGYLSVAEAALRATVCESVIRAWIADGSLPHFRFGRRGRRGTIRIAVEDLNGAMAAFRVAVVRTPPPRAKMEPPVLKHIRVK